MAVTIKDIARRTGVSIATVSRALSEAPTYPVAEETRRRVREEAERLGYVRNEAARLLVQGQATLVALLPDWGTSLFADSLAWHVGEALIANDLAPLNVHCSSPSGDGAATLPGLPLAGGIVLECGEVQQKNIELLQQRNASIVSVGGTPLPNTDRVEVDLALGGELAAQHLLSTGRRRLVMAAPAQARPTGDARRNGFQNAVVAAGLEAGDFEVPAAIVGPEVRAAAREWVAAGNLPDGLFCHNDELAFALLRALLEAGVRVPDDVAVVGFDGLPEGELYWPSLTTVAYPFDAVASEAVAMLAARIEDPEAAPQFSRLAPKLVIRETA